MIIDRILLKFIIVGCANTIVGAGLMFVLYNVFGLGYWISSAANYAAGSVLSFFLNKYWTFNVRKRSFFMVIAFAANIVISYILAYKLTRTAVYFVLRNQSAVMQDNIALACGICLFTGLNYIGQRFVVFSGTDQDCFQWKTLL